MSTQLRHWKQHMYTTMRKAGSQLGRPAAVLTAVTGALLSFASAAFASTSTVEPVPGAGGQYGTAPGGTTTGTRVITVGGMPGWQIALIALGAALVGAAAAVILDRTLARRPRVSAMTA
jgi:hypothetical protein